MGSHQGSRALGSSLSILPKGAENISWNLFNSDGSHAGTVVYSSTSPQASVQEGNVSTFTIPVTIALDDGSIVSSNEVKCYDFDYLVNAPSDPSVLQTRGICSGIVNRATGSLSTALGNPMDHRYVYQFKIVNGQRMFDKINWGPWIIHR
jgi:hypothetical protein